MESKKIAQTLVAYSGIGLQLGITVFLFVYAGYLADKRFSTEPLALILGLIAGVCLGIYNMIRVIRNIEEKIRKDKSIIDNHNKTL